jgi:type IV pilus assembly protein PilB
VISVDDYFSQLASDPTRLAQEFGWPKVDVAGVMVAPEVLDLAPRIFALSHNLLPLAREGSRLHVAVADPLDTDGPDALGCLTGLEISPALAAAADIRAAIEHHYGKGAVSPDEWVHRGDSGGGLAADENSPTVEFVEETADDAPIISLVQALMHEAVRRRASDIHLEPLEKRLRVRYRVDGVLLEAESPPKQLQPAIISRLKIMADISIAEKRIPQDGRIQVDLAGRTLDLRVSSLPTVHGESMVMRILDREGLQRGLPELGFFADDRRALERVLALPDGIVLVTGPTGSGKTTTLYSALHHLNQPDRKIITVEDPVEYQLAGVNQVPVRPDIGMTFASALRAMLRQSPNIVMIGEIRDRETAEIALNASLTGHMVFSTLHTNDAAGAVTRLIDLGAQPFLIAAALRAVLAQRLVRRVCESCRRPHRPEPHELRALKLDPAQAAAATFMKGAGCPACHGTGYRGRTGIYELMVINDELQAMIHARVGSSKLRDKARAFGLRSLREDGARKVTAGLTTVEEVVSITAGDD